MNTKIESGRLPTVKTSCIVALVIVTLSVEHVAAQTVHYWRLEDGPDFLRDIVNEAHLESIGDDVAAAEVSGANGRGAFPQSFTGGDINSTSAEFTDGFDGFVAENAAIESDDSFTVELFANVANYQDQVALFHLVSQAAPAVIPTETYWSFQIRTDGDNGTVDRELNVNFGGNAGWHGTPSGILIDDETDYYLSAAFDHSSREVRYFARNLNERSLRISSVPYVQDQLQYSDEFLIGDVPACSCPTDGLIDEIRISKGVLDFPETLLGQAEFGDSGYGAIETIVLSPRDAYQVREDRTTNLRASISASVASTQKPVLKFELPNFVEPEELESATLRLFVSSATEENAELDLWHSLTDNDFEREVGDFADASYVDTQRDVFAAGDENGNYMDVDVTELVRADFSHDANDPVSAFRLSTSDGARFRISMPRRVGQQPLLLFSLRGSTIVGDCNDDGVLDANDIDLLTAAIGGNDLSCDVNSDGKVDLADHAMWVKDLKHTWYGDSNLDGEFSSVDFILVFQAGKFESGQSARWNEGDWNGDGVFSSGDFVTAFQDGGYEQGQRAAPVVSVPEPELATWFPIIAILIAYFRMFSATRSRFEALRRNMV